MKKIKQIDTDILIIKAENFIVDFQTFEEGKTTFPYIEVEYDNKALAALTLNYEVKDLIQVNGNLYGISKYDPIAKKEVPTRGAISCLNLKSKSPTLETNEKITLYVSSTYTKPIIITCKLFQTKDSIFNGGLQIEADLCLIHQSNLNKAKTFVTDTAVIKKSQVEKVTALSHREHLSLDIDESFIDEIRQNGLENCIINLKSSNVKCIDGNKLGAFIKNSTIEKVEVHTDLKDGIYSFLDFRESSLNQVVADNTNINYKYCKFKNGGSTKVNNGEIQIENKEYKLNRIFNKVYIKKEEEKVYTFEGKIKRKKIK